MTRPGRLLLATLAATGILLLFAVAMTRDVTYDEDQYIAAGVLARYMLPYRDFIYLQGPLYPLLLGAVFRLVDGWFLLTARLLTFGLAVTAAALLWRILRTLGAGPWLAALLMAACLASPFLAAPLANTRNDALPLTLFLAGLLAHLHAPRSLRSQLLAGLLMGLAAEAKISYLFAPAILGLHALLTGRSQLLATSLGVALAALPAAICALLAPEAMRFGVVNYHLVAPWD